jgi:hypothetical protein
MVKTRATTNEHDHRRRQRKQIRLPKEDIPRGTKTIVIKETTAKTRDTVAMEKKTTGAAKKFRQKNPESTTHHHRIC